MLMGCVFDNFLKNADSSRRSSANSDIVTYNHKKDDLSALDKFVQEFLPKQLKMIVSLLMFFFKNCNFVSKNASKNLKFYQSL